ncbi:hypothetical protein K402DRAFT_412964 [Aulographum hederae CBS 113979]|uniref:Uncharacterized protein n=1 Tax=Aulographum hederae CBS 113979 TaxID=1176131 RepID=A0A6G1GYA7_9PEZI|nr:hypothetical protein K402DRAFT_412964 [Aulographum hederae CBS 113979]
MEVYKSPHAVSPPPRHLTSLPKPSPHAPRSYTTPDLDSNPSPNSVLQLPHNGATTSPQNRTIRTPHSVTAAVHIITPHENIYTLPNILTFSRLAAAPVIGYFILYDHHVWAVGLFAYAGFTDLIDGWIARRWKLQTVVGSVVDPMADKILMTVMVGCLAANGTLPLPVWLATLIFGRDASLALAALYYRYASLPSPKTFSRYWDFSLPSAEVHPTTVSKYNTFLQLVLIGATTTVPLLSGHTVGGVEVETIVTGMGYVVAATTLWSGASYVWLKDAVTILGEDETLKKKQGRTGRMIIGEGEKVKQEKLVEGP